jgi:hypothetical protein
MVRKGYGLFGALRQTGWQFGPASRGPNSRAWLWGLAESIWDRVVGVPGNSQRCEAQGSRVEPAFASGRRLQGHYLVLGFREIAHLDSENRLS